MRPLLLVPLAALLAAGEAEPAPLTLDAALRTALERNQTVEVVRARQARAAAQRRQAVAALLPSLAASAQVQRSAQDHDAFGRKPDESAADSLRADLVLVDPAAWMNVDAARSGADALVHDAGELRRGLAFDVARAWFQCWSADFQVSAAQRRREVATRTVEQGRARIAAGVATGNDGTRNELELAAAEVGLTAARLAVRTARLQLSNLMDAAAEGPLAEPPACPAPAGDGEALAVRAELARADLRAAELRVEAGRASVRQARSAYLPTLGVSGSWGVGQDRTEKIYADGVPTWTVALNARWTLYDGGARWAAADQSYAQMREDQALLTKARRQLRTDLATAQAELDSAQVGVGQAELQVRVARLNLQEVEARAAQGMATGLQVSDASTALHEADSSLIARRLAEATARLRLRQLVGWWPLAEGAP